MGQLVGTWPETWHRSRLFRALSLGGYVAFDLPRAVTALGAVVLLALAGTHVYMLISSQSLPAYFVGYAVAVIACCVVIAATLGLGRNPRVPQAAWLAGSLLSVVLLAVDVVTRVASLPGMTTVTGRWDFAPATFVLAFAGAFLGLHASVLLGINVAHPQRQHWED